DVIVETYDEVGMNYRMSDLQAAVGVAQMARLDGLLAERRRLALRYSERLVAETPWLQPPFCPDDRTHTYQSYIARVGADAPVPRDDLMRHLLQRGVQSRRGIMNTHEEPAYVSRFGRRSLPESERASAATIILP